MSGTRVDHEHPYGVNQSLMVHLGRSRRSLPVFLPPAFILMHLMVLLSLTSLIPWTSHISLQMQAFFSFMWFVRLGLTYPVIPRSLLVSLHRAVTHILHLQSLWVHLQCYRCYEWIFHHFFLQQSVCHDRSLLGGMKPLYSGTNRAMTRVSRGSQNTHYSSPVVPNLPRNFFHQYIFLFESQ